MRWTIHLEGGPRRVNHAAVAIGNKIFSFGGYCTGENYRVHRPMDVHILNTVNYRWHALPVPKPGDPQYSEVPYQRYGHTAVGHGDLIYVWGGRNDEAACNILFCFDTTTLKWSRVRVNGMVPGARDGHSACVINKKMYIFGGYEEDINRFSQDVHALDLETMTWTYHITKGDPPEYRDFHSASAIGTCMYVFGGRGDRQGPYHSQDEVYCNQIMYLDTLSQVWHRPKTRGLKPVGRRSHSAFVYKGCLFIFGGYNGLDDSHFNDFHRFDPVNSEWSLVNAHGKSPCERRRQSCCLVGNKLFLFGGTSPYQGQTLSIPWEFEDFQSEGVESRLMDHNDLHVLDFAPSLKSLCMVAVIEGRLDQSLLPQDIRLEIKAATTNNTISRPLNSTG